MGVSGLLQLLKSIHKPCHLRDYKGKTLAVDAYGWLHRGAAACAIELAEGKSTTKWLDFVMHRTRMLVHFGVTPYLVFDGDRLPSKAATEKGRRERREKSRAEGLAYLKLGKIPLAYQELQKAVDITPEMARMCIEALRMSDIRYVVAPYEADSQMVYLEQQGIVDGILSEDSDLLVFGARCLLTKLDQYGECILVDRNRFTACREINLTGWSSNEFRTMAILSGCDYLDSISKMGLKTAYRLVRKYKTIEHVLRGAMLEKKLRIPPDYLQQFTQAEHTFLYQWVFCPTAERLVHFNSLPRTMREDALPFIGEAIDAGTARGVAEGDLDPMTKQTIHLSSQQWGDVRKHIRKAPMARIRPQPSSLTTKPKDLPGQSIESFFKRQRIPLAELDPNTFKPSENQQRLLDSQQDQPEWEARSSFGPDNAPSVPPVLRSYSAPAFQIPAARPPKRRKLCDDSPSKAAAQTERSKFFGRVKTDLEERPLQTRQSKRKANQLDFNIFSDDSIEGAMAEAADAVSKPSVAKKMTVFCDDDTEHHVSTAPPVVEDPQNETIATKSLPPRAEDASPFSATLRNETKAMREQTSLQAFAFERDRTALLLDAKNLAPSVSTPEERSATAPHNTMPESPLATPFKPSTAPSSTHDIIWDSPPTQLHTQSKAHSLAASVSFQTPSWTHDDSGYGSQLESFVVKGSEDWLVPRSDTEPESSRRGSLEDEVCVHGSSPSRGENEKCPLNLGRFAFGA